MCRPPAFLSPYSYDTFPLGPVWRERERKIAVDYVAGREKVFSPALRHPFVIPVLSHITPPVPAAT